MAKGKSYYQPQNSISPITPIGKGRGTAYQWQMPRYINYTPAIWRIVSDRMINSCLGQDWSALVSWMLSSEPIIQMLIQRRLSPMKSLEFIIKNEDGEKNEALTNLICKQIWFYELIDAIMLAIFQGFSAIQLDIKNNQTYNYPLELIDYKKKSLKHMFADTEGTEVFNDYSNMAYFEYNKNHQTVLGLYQPMTLEVIAISLAKANWDGFGTNVAVPTKLVYYNAGSINRQQEVDQYGQPVFDDLGNPVYVTVNNLKDVAQDVANNSNPNMVLTLPMSVDDNGKIIEQIVIKESQHSAHTSQAYKTYEERIRMSYESLSLLVLGSSLTTSEGSSRSLGEVHERATNQMLEGDKKWVLDCLNQIMIYKFDLPEGLTFGIDEAQKSSIDEAIKISQIVNSNNRKLTDEFFQKIGLPENYIEEVKEEEAKEIVKEEKKVKKKVPKDKPKKTGLNSIVENVKEFVGIKEEQEFEEIEESIFEDKEIVTKFAIPTYKLNYKNYNLNSTEYLMNLCHTVELKEHSEKELYEIFNKSIYINNKNQYCLKNYNSDEITLFNLDLIDNIGSNLLKETLLSPSEVWESKGRLVNNTIYLKFYNNVTYSVILNKKTIKTAKCLRSYKEVEDLRKGLLII